MFFEKGKLYFLGESWAYAGKEPMLCLKVKALKAFKGFFDVEFYSFKTGNRTIYINIRKDDLDLCDCEEISRRIET